MALALGHVRHVTAVPFCSAHWIGLLRLTAAAGAEVLHLTVYDPAELDLLMSVALLGPAVILSSGGRNSVGVVSSTIQTFDQRLLTAY